MKRVILFVNGTDVNGKVSMVTHSLDELLTAASSKFHITAKRIFTPQGGEIDDIKLIRDDDVLYVSSGEDFISKKQIYNHSQLNKNSEWITLNVGGKYFTTTRDTLTKKEPMSVLASMFNEAGNNEQIMLPSRQDQTGAFLIDRSPTYFEPLLNFLRHGQIILDDNVNVAGVLAEARFYRIEGAISILVRMADAEDFEKENLRSLTRKDVLKTIMSTPTTSELRFQAVDFVDADLTGLDLRNINFKCAVMHGCSLAGANLSGCCFERADLCHANLSYANLQGAQLVGVRMFRANLTAANLQSCNFEDPGDLPANMEGVILRGANLEGSKMAAANLRMATLQDANLRNCDLRSAVLAGADLERCDLTGSDLHEANLRGANLKDAALKLMLRPLHMSQTIR